MGKGKQAAGIVLYKKVDGEIKVFLIHNGGPFFAKKDVGAWGIPKGEFEESETPFETAKREFEEETSFKVDGDFIELTPIVQKNGKKVFAFALEGDTDPAKIKSNTFQMEWQPKSGKMQEFPEVDKAEWFTLEKAKEVMILGQSKIIEELEQKLK